jgi:teichuronic acid exporter
VSNSLKSKTIHALYWSFLEAIGLQGVQFIIGIILARLLLPEQFGLIAMLTIFIAVSESLINGGFARALIQKKEATQTDISSVFYVNIAVGLTATGILFFLAPLIAEFYSQPILSLLTKALSFTVVLNSFGMIHYVILAKRIEFRTVTKVNLIASLLSGAIGVTLAALSYGVWSLVVQQITSTLFRTSLLWIFNPWRPALVFSLKSLHDMFGFGSRVLASDLLNQIFENIYLLVIGRIFSAADLGYFARAKSIQEVPTHTLSGMVGRVTFPVFSSIQDDRARLKRSLRKTLTILVLVNFPIMIGIAAVAHPLVVVVLTEKWTPCIPYLSLLCFVGLLYPVHLINLNALQALGRSDLFLRLELIKKVLIVINIAVTWQWGISAMIWGMLALSIISYYLNSYYTGVLLGYRIGEQLRDLLPYLSLSVLMGIAVYSSGLIPYPNYWFMLLVQITIGIITYVSLCRLFRLPAFMELWQGGWNRMQLLRTGVSG